MDRTRAGYREFDVRRGGPYPSYHAITFIKLISLQALWDVVRKSVRKPGDPLSPPPGSTGIDTILAEARATLQRLTPKQAYDELHDPQLPGPVFLVDIRPAAQREAEGGIHGSLIIERNVLEWRFDPRSTSRLTIVDQYDLRVIVFCQDGSASSLAAVSLNRCESAVCAIAALHLD